MSDEPGAGPWKVTQHPKLSGMVMDGSGRLVADLSFLRDVTTEERFKELLESVARSYLIPDFTKFLELYLGDPEENWTEQASDLLMRANSVTVFAEPATHHHPAPEPELPEEHSEHEHE